MTDDDVLGGMMSMVEDNASVDVESTTENNSTSTNNSEDNYTLTLTKDNFVKLTSALTIIQDICNDCDIKNGKIRCRTNDHKNMILMDLSGILGDHNISFGALKNKLSLLSTFNLVAEGTTNTDVLIEANDSNFEFTDCLSKLITRRPISSYLENIYLTDEEFQQINESMNREDSVIFNVTINSMEKKRISKLCDAFCANTVMFEFNGSTASYTTQTSSKDNVSKTVQTINLLKNIEGKKTSVNNLGFTLDTPSNLDITCYQTSDNYCMIKSNLNYYGIPITIYTKSRIVDLNDED